jgi:heme-binding protein
MSRRLKQAAVVFVVVFVAAQLVRPERANPASDVSRTIQARVGTANGLATVLDRACGDCHSNATEWSSWYTQIAPLSWLMAHEVAEGRKAFNFSEWAAYSPAQQRMLLAVSCDDAKSGKMPGPYTLFKPNTRLSSEEVNTICEAARQADAHAAGASR